MNRTQFEELVTRTEAANKAERLVKGNDYAKPDEDILSNFKELADRLAGAPMDAITVWAVYLEKHIFAIERFVRDRQLSSETIESRFTDASNYLHLGRALLQEARQEETINETAPAQVDPEPVQEDIRKHYNSGARSNLVDILFGRNK